MGWFYNSPDSNADPVPVLSPSPNYTSEQIALLKRAEIAKDRLRKRLAFQDAMSERLLAGAKSVLNPLGMSRDFDEFGYYDEPTGILRKVARYSGPMAGEGKAIAGSLGAILGALGGIQRPGTEIFANARDWRLPPEPDDSSGVPGGKGVVSVRELPQEVEEPASLATESRGPFTSQDAARKLWGPAYDRIVARAQARDMARSIYRGGLPFVLAAGQVQNQYRQAFADRMRQALLQAILSRLGG